MRYKNRLVYYAAVAGLALILLSAPPVLATPVLVGGAMWYLPLTLLYWIFHEVMLGRWLTLRRSEPATVIRIAAGLAFVGAAVIVYGIGTRDLLAAQIGAAVLFNAGETYITRHEVPQGHAV